MVDCPTPQKQQQVQQVMNDLSKTLLLEADSILEKAPLIKKNESIIRNMFNIISKNGIGMGTIAKIMPLVGQIKR